MGLRKFVFVSWLLVFWVVCKRGFSACSRKNHSNKHKFSTSPNAILENTAASYFLLPASVRSGAATCKLDPVVSSPFKNGRPLEDWKKRWVGEFATSICVSILLVVTLEPPAQSADIVLSVCSFFLSPLSPWCVLSSSLPPSAPHPPHPPKPLSPQSPSLVCMYVCMHVYMYVCM